MRLPDGVRQRGQSLMVDVTVHGIRKTGTVKGIDVAGALTLRESLKESILKTIREGSPSTVSDTWTLKQAYDKVCELYWNAEQSRSWVKLRQNGQFILNYFGEDRKVTEITSDHIDAFCLKLKEDGLTGATINRKTSALSRMLTAAVKKDKLARKPIIERKEESEGRIRWITQAEEKTILATFDQWGMDEQSEIVCVLVDTGLRPSELWRLAARDVDFLRGCLHIWKTKNKLARVVPMTQRVKDILTRRTEGRVGLVFPYNNYWLNRHWKTMKNHLGMATDKEFVPYCLRHTCASRLVQRGVALLIIKEWLGHKSILTTMRYTKNDPGHLMDAVKVLEA